MTIDHFSFYVPPTKYEETVDFYLALLGPLGYKKQVDMKVAVGLGTDEGSPKFWIGSKEGTPSTSYFHLAFKAKSHELVHQCYDAAVKFGGKDNGPPGPRAKYHPNYYGAFVLDPMGNNIEVVDHSVH